MSAKREIPDYGAIFERELNRGKKKEPKNSRYAPYGQFRWLIIGKTGGGKTNAMIHCILNYMRFEHIYLYARDLQEPIYAGFMKKLTDIAEENGVPPASLFTASEDSEDIIAPEQLDGRRCIIVFDDQITAPPAIQKRIQEHFIRSRKKNASMIYLSQTYYGLPRIIRLNASAISFFKLQDNTEIARIARQISADIDPQKFIQIYKKAVKKQFGFILFDMANPDILFKYRIGFTKPLLSSESDSSDSCESSEST